MAIAAPAITRLTLSAARPRSWLSERVSTWFRRLPVLITTNGQKKLFQAYKKVKVARVARAGTLAGKKMRHRISRREAPSINAASSISLGMVMKNWRIKKVP